MLESLPCVSYGFSYGYYPTNGHLEMILCPVLIVSAILQGLLDNSKSLSMLKVYVLAILGEDGTFLLAHRHITMFLRGARYFSQPYSSNSLVWALPLVPETHKSSPSKPIYEADLKYVSLLVITSEILLCLTLLGDKNHHHGLQTC